MQIKFKSLSIKNFLSYGNVPTVVVLDRPGTTLICGEDLDNSSTGVGANGVGKSVLLNALVYAVYDKPVSNISKDNLVNNVNKKNMEVIIEFDMNGKSYRIQRARKAKAGAAGNYVYLYEDGKDITPDSVSNTNEKIEQIIGIPYELFVRIVAFSANHVPFLDLPVRSPTGANQTDIIEELFDLKTLSQKANVLKEHIKQTELSLSTHLERAEQIKREQARHEKQIESASKRVENWDITNAKEIDDLERKLRQVKEVDIDLQRSLHNELSEVEANLRATMSHHQQLEKHIKDLTKISNTKKSELTHLRDQQCPFCLQQYKDSENKIVENENAIALAEKDIVVLEKELDLVADQVEMLAQQHKNIKQNITVGDLDGLMKMVSEQHQYQARLDELNNTVNPFLEPLEELQSIELDQIDMTEINDLKKMIEHQNFLLKLLTKKDSFVRKALLNKNIPFLNQRLAYYLTELGLPHTVEFTHEMTASISQFGRTLDFGNLSNGQRARVNLALSFAFRDVLQSIHCHVNVCILDEVLDVGLDAVGVQAAAKMLKRKARDEKSSIYIISHRDEIDSAFDQRMIVQLSKGFSYVKFQDD